MEKRISMRNWCQSVAKRLNLPFQPKRPSFTRGWFLGDPGISHKLVPPVPISLPPWVHLNLDSHLLLPLHHPTSTPPLVPQPKVPLREHKDIVTPLVGLAQLLVSRFVLLPHQPVLFCHQPLLFVAFEVLNLGYLVSIVGSCPKAL